MKSVLKKIAVFFVPRKIRKILAVIRQQDKAQKILMLQMKQIVQMVTGLKFQSQSEQDMFAYFYFNGKTNGFYVDIGAHDGKSLNNTMLFEELGWQGVCVEPQPDIFEELQKNRSCDCYNVAVSNTSSESFEFIRAVGVNMLSGLSSQMTEAHKKRIIRENGKLEKISVKTLTFDELMGNYPERYYIDFMSIDIEGAEMSILKAIDFAKYNFGFITVENNEEIKGHGNRLVKFMAEQGYKLYFDCGEDLMFVPKSKTSVLS